ncbi:hypothetical protein BCR41DRAFT_358812 [Lobosporangium transversale]|uniref:Uncharacterized protein n=1 Tax=Lobosporangium transversale TaxID=64571 RepID=A0A1Y2GF50_9FUNG|nr:hypothetical protein BCR41DRAFT_358812 [Lobosporangium transversale]ORZ09057.1 hypothetical protein BCR41DRAFT_358812 [Lobosporangium transversale]|eukprot:XP_021878684.1 hypothetical protein BCR41DRAFT_358812 [Lobosporangium transversale]
MSFGPQTGFLKGDFIMSTLLAILGFIVLGSMAKNSWWEILPGQSVCLLLGNPRELKFHSSACVFTVFVGFMIAAGGIGLFSMDYVTWKRSERFKGRRASIAALLISPIMSFFSFSTAIVIGTGITKFCNNFDVNGHSRPDICHAASKDKSQYYLSI